MRAELQADLAEAFDEDLADAVTTHTGEREGDSSYDPTTGQVTTTTINYHCRGILTRYSRQDVEFYGVPRTDRKLVVLQNEVLDEDGSRVVPQVGDTIAGMAVKDVDHDPVDATYEIQLEGPA